MFHGPPTLKSISPALSNNYNILGIVFTKTDLSKKTKRDSRKDTQISEAVAPRCSVTKVFFKKIDLRAATLLKTGSSTDVFL